MLNFSSATINLFVIAALLGAQLLGTNIAKCNVVDRGALADPPQAVKLAEIGTLSVGTQTAEFQAKVKESTLLGIRSFSNVYQN
ncbi:MAG TPA: hypothetical protein VGL77_18000, partial [Armatimonadota bacterium]